MTIRALRHDDALETIWDDLVYTEARLAADPRTKDLAKVVGKLVDRVEKVESEQRAKWRAETVTQAGVDKCDDDLDDQVAALSNDLAHAEGGDKSAPRYKRYFTSPASLVLRLGLKSEIDKVRGWVKSLRGEKEPALKSHGKALETIVAASDAALEGRQGAQSARADHRIQHIYPLVDDLNAARLSIAGELDKRAAKGKLARDFSARFFRHAVRAPQAAQAGAQPAPEAPPPAQAS